MKLDFDSVYCWLRFFYCVGKIKSESCDKQSLQDRNKDLSGTL